LVYQLPSKLSARRENHRSGPAGSCTRTAPDRQCDDAKEHR